MRSARTWPFSSRIARVAGVLALALLAACDASPPAGQQVSAPATPTSAPAAVTPSVAPTASVQPTDAPAPAATLQPTDAPAPTASAQPTDAPAPTAPPANTPPASAVPFAAIIDVTGNNVLGGVQGSRWISAELAAPLIAGGEEYRLIREGALVGTGQGSAPRKGEVPCDWTYQVDISNSTTDAPVDYELGQLAVGGAWELFPRSTQELDVNMPVYREAVAAELQARSIAAPNVQIARIMRADLEGDGVAEVIISATFYRDRAEDGGILPGAAAGDYSLVLLRRLVDGQVVTTAVAEEYYTEDKEFVAPLEHRLVGVMDLNGDGTLEVLVNSNYYEGFSLGVYAVSGTTIEQVLSEGCGV